MKVREYAGSWPPIITIGSADADLADRVLSLRKYSHANDRIILEAVDRNGRSYGVPLVLPEDALQRAINALNKKLPLTLGQVGDLNI